MTSSSGIHVGEAPLIVDENTKKSEIIQKEGVPMPPPPNSNGNSNEESGDDLYTTKVTVTAGNDQYVTTNGTGQGNTTSGQYISDSESNSSSTDENGMIHLNVTTTGKGPDNVRKVSDVSDMFGQYDEPNNDNLTTTGGN